MKRQRNTLLTRLADDRSWIKAAKATVGEVWTVVFEGRDGDGWPVTEVTVGPIIRLATDDAPLELRGKKLIGDHCTTWPLKGRVQNVLCTHGRYYAVRGEQRTKAPVDSDAAAKLRDLPDDLAVTAEYEMHHPAFRGTRVTVTGLLKPIDPGEPAGRMVGDTWVSAREVTHIEAVPADVAVTS